MKKTDSSVETLVEDQLSNLKPADLNDVEKQSLITLAMKVLAIKHRAGRALSFFSSILLLVPDNNNTPKPNPYFQIVHY